MDRPRCCLVVTTFCVGSSTRRRREKVISSSHSLPAAATRERRWFRTRPKTVLKWGEKVLVPLSSVYARFCVYTYLHLTLSCHILSQVTL